MAQHPCPPLRYKYPCLKFTYKEAMELLRVKVNPNHPDWPCP